MSRAETRSATSLGARGKARSLRDTSYSRRTLDPEFPTPAATPPPRKKLIPTPLYISQVTFSGGPIETAAKSPRRDTQISTDNMLARPAEVASFAPKHRDAHHYRCTNTSAVPYLSGNRSEVTLPTRKRPQQHLASSIPYLSNDGYEPKFEPRDPNYRSEPIWLREAIDNNSRKRLSTAKQESLRSTCFEGKPESPTPLTLKIKAFALSESFAEKPMFNSRKPKPENLRNPFASSFVLA